MQLKNLVFLFIFAAFTSILWAAGGRDANVSRTAEDPSGFTDQIDTSNRKPGKWNYVIEARDKGGNLALSGPENIYIDPESDLPRVTVINPVQNMRVQGNLNLVGIAVDDDGVKSVHFTINRGRDGNGEELVRAQATGTDYWSYFLDTSDSEIWTDGYYTITAWAIDITDLSGIADQFPNGARVHPRQHKKHTVIWNLDRKKPETIITSHETGALVSNNIRLRGTVADGNGISSFQFSTDGGERYTPVRVSENRALGVYNWEINLNTRTLQDGPAVIWFQARDGNRTLGTAAHLLFINNTGPDVKIMHPEPSAVLNGIFSLAGYAQHPVGLKSITWRAGTASGDIELLPGNHWWTADVDLRAFRGTSVDVEIRAEDVSGNVTVTRQRYRMDQQRDLPIVTLQSPLPGIINNEAGLIVKGTVADDDAVESIFYSLNGGAAVEIPSTDYFQFRITDLPEGTHFIEVWAKDIHGTLGPRVAVRGIVVPPGLPTFAISNVTARSIVSPFYTGMTLRALPIINARTGAITGYERMTMQVSVRASAVPVSASVTFGEGAPIPVRFSGSGTTFTTTVQVPDTLMEGLNIIQLRATDRHSREVVYNEYAFYTRNQDPYEPPAAGFEFTWSRPNTLTDGRVLLTSLDDVLLGVSSMPLRSVTVSGNGSNLVNASIDEFGRIALKAVGEGDIGPLTMRVQTDTSAYTTPPVRMLSAFSAPVITMTGMTPYAWVRNQAPVRFGIASRARVTAVEYSLDMGESWSSMGAVASDYTRNLDITSAYDGSITVLIRAINEAGRSSIEHFTVLKDTQVPVPELLIPIAEARVNGTIRMAFKIEEAGSLQSVAYRRNSTASPIEIFNANNTDKLYNPRFLEVLMDSIRMPLDNNMRFAFTDKSGNTSEIATWPFIIDQQMDIPVVNIILPLEDEVITTDFIASGVMYDDDGIKNAQWRLDNGPWQTIDATTGFSIPIFLSSLTDNEHRISVIAEDIYGVRSAETIRRFRVSLREPAASVTYPLVDTVLKDAVEIRGTSFDRNGIKQIQVSLDNGNTFNNVRGNFGTPTENVPWTYQFNTRVLKDGPHVLFVRVIDRYDVPATYAAMINVDNTAPVIFLDSPVDGFISTGQISVMGEINDPNLKEVSIQLRGLDGQQVSAALRSRTVDPETIVREYLNLTGQADGNYNVAIIATDKAGNVTRVSRNFELARTTMRNYIEILYPLENEPVAGMFNLYGYAGGSDTAESVTIRINGRDITQADVKDGYFRFNMDSDMLTNGINNVIVHSNFGGSSTVQSRAYSIDYSPTGPWVTIDSFTFGDFAYSRPYLFGRSGYILTEEERAALADRTTDRETRAALAAKTLDYAEISFDNGRTFTRTSSRGSNEYDYRYRLETGEMPEGVHYILIRSTMQNGEIAVTRMLVQVDKTPPVIRLLSPEMGGRYNTEIVFSASARDDIELTELTYRLRIGDKAFYSVPGFLQGMYFEVTIPPFLKQIAPDFMPNVFAGGATYMDVGFGLSFYDDNVKVQVQYGFMTQGLYESLGGVGQVRYGGHVLGLKILASIYTLPFISIWGPDFEWLSATFSVGANFSLFDAFNTPNPSYPGETYTQSGSSTWMSALLFQIEFPKVTLPNRKNFRTFSLFTEGQLWFVPTDVDAKKNNIPVVIPKIILGLRAYIF